MPNQIFDAWNCPYNIDNGTETGMCSMDGSSCEYLNCPLDENDEGD